MADESALQQAKQQVAELLKAAKSGMIIPIRLPGQIESIAALLDKADEENADALAKASASGGGDLGAYKTDQAAFMSHAVHELRTPMTSIRGYADMMNSMGGLNDMQKQLLETIRANAKRMVDLLQDVSDISKLRGGTMRVNAKMDMFKNIAGMVEKAARPAVEEFKRRLTLDVPSGLPLLNVDGELLGKALYKLVENGLRYSPEDTGEVVLSAANEDNTLVITVRDNGIGMTPEDIQQLGTLYFRGDNDTVRNFKGSGIGVPIAYGIVALLGGTIACQSEPDKGTTFTIRMKGIS